MLKACIFAVALVLGIGAAHAKEAQPLEADPVVEQRAAKLEQELRCLVCQNQTIADSHADLAQDLRNEIRDQIKKGATDQQVKEYMVARYGDFVLYRPPVKTSTYLLWFGPALFVLFGAFVLVRTIRNRRRVTEVDPDAGIDDENEDPLAAVRGERA